jgi:lysophospholipase L1-like esterase
MKLSKTWFTIFVFGLLSLFPYALPSMEHFQFLNLRRLSAPLAAWGPDALDRVFVRPRPANAPPVAPLSATAQTSEAEDEAAPNSLLSGDYAGKNWPVQDDVQNIVREQPDQVAIQDFGCAMDHFYAALLDTEEKQPGAITRICHFGDSPISGDLISGAARTLLQNRFGDSGHGFIFIAKPWDFYYHEGIHMEGKGWKVSSPVLPGGGGGSFGLGGASFTASSPAAYSHIRTTAKGEGSAVSRYNIFYRAQPHGGSFNAYVDKDPARDFSTSSDTRGSVMVTINVKDGGHTLKITPQGDGPVTLYGVALERDEPGVVYDTLGLLGGTVHHLTFFHDDWIQDLQNRKPDLVILNFGTNESNYGYLPYAEYIHSYTLVIRRIRTALPDASILIMAPMDRGARDDDGDIVTIPSIPILVAAQESIARADGVAFFNTFAAMGGMGTMARWYDDQPRLVTGDFTHPSYTGAAQLGSLLVNALLKGYEDYKKNLGGTPCTPPGTAAKTTSASDEE